MIVAEQLKTVIDRIENIEVEIKELQDARSDIYKEASGNGFDKAILKAIIRLRKKDPHERSEEAMLLDTYLSALGMA